MKPHACRPASGPRIRRRFVPGLCFVLLVAAAAAQPPRRDAPAPSPNDWITVNKDYSSQRYVDLDRITPANVSQLKEICELQLNVATWFNSGLLMVGRTIYVNTMRSTYALDAATCALIWQHDIDFTPGLATVSNRGAAYLAGRINRIFRGTADGRVIALDAVTGTPLWDVQAADPTRNEAFTAAPVAWNGKVFIGIVTADLGVRGRLMAFDAEDGRELWRFHTIPIGIEEGASTWPPPPAIPPGAPPGTLPVAPAGGAFWTSFSLDSATGELFGPVSNPYPDYVRIVTNPKTGEPYQNLYTNSVISLDAVKGTLNWYFQAIKGDDHDWDLGAPPTLYSTPSGKSMLAVAGKEGFVFGIDRASKQRVFKTPGTTIANTEPVDDSLRLACPGSIGGAQWNGTAYHPGLGTLYTGMVDFCFYYSASFYGADPGFWEPPDQNTVRADFSKPPQGWITAVDGETGEVKWQYQAEGQVLAGLVPTRSGLLFAGDVRGNLLALDAKSGAVLKRIDAKGALNNGLISYEVDRTQYVAAAVGGLTLNPAGVSGPLRVAVYGLGDVKQPRIVKLPKRTVVSLLSVGGRGAAKMPYFSLPFASSSATSLCSKASIRPSTAICSACSARTRSRSCFTVLLASSIIFCCWWKARRAGWFSVSRGSDIRPPLSPG